MISIQELINLKADDYKDNLDTLIHLTNQLIDNRKYEKAIELRENAIRLSIENNENKSDHINCAKYYLHYADALIIKMMETQDLFNNNMENIEEKNDEENEEPTIDENQTNNINNNFNNINTASK